MIKFPKTNLSIKFDHFHHSAQNARNFHLQKNST